MGDSDKDKIEGVTDVGNAASVDIKLDETATEDGYGQLSFSFAAPKTRHNTTARRPISRMPHAGNAGSFVNTNSIDNTHSADSTNNAAPKDGADNKTSTDNAEKNDIHPTIDDEYEQLSLDFGKSRDKSEIKPENIKLEADNKSETKPDSIKLESDDQSDISGEPVVAERENKTDAVTETAAEPEEDTKAETADDTKAEEPEEETTIDVEPDDKIKSETLEKSDNIEDASSEAKSETIVSSATEAAAESSSTQETETDADTQTDNTASPDSDAAAKNGCTAADAGTHTYKPRHIVRKLLIGAAVLAAAAYCGGAYYFHSHFLPDTYAGGVDISYLDAAEAEQKLQSEFVYDSVLLKGRDGEETLDLSDTGLVKTFSDTAEAINTQDNLSWFTAFFDANHDSGITLSVSCDEDKLEAKIAELAILNPDNISKPTDAYPRLNTDTNLYEVEAETEGNEINQDALKEAVHNALNARDRLIDLESAGVYTQPIMRSDSSLLAGQIAWMNAINAAGATFDLDAGLVIPVNGELVGALVGTDGMADEEAVRAYVTGLAATYNTVSPDKQRSFINHNNEEKIIKTSYGWQLNEDKTYPLLFELINKVITDTTVLNAASVVTDADSAATEAVFNPEDYAIKAVWKRVAAKHEENDIGSTYVEIDMGEQNVYIYVDGNCVLTTPCVTGRMTKGRITPEGIYQIQYKQKSRYLTGRNPDGSISYRSYVNYWMPFNGGIGLHDATWRSKFGGTYYVYGGSHGCINLPLDMAKQIYDIVYTGMLVICYY